MISIMYISALIKSKCFGKQILPLPFKLLLIVYFIICLPSLLPVTQASYLSWFSLLNWIMSFPCRCRSLRAIWIHRDSWARDRGHWVPYLYWKGQVNYHPSLFPVSSPSTYAQSPAIGKHLLVYKAVIFIAGCILESLEELKKYWCPGLTQSSENWSIFRVGVGSPQVILVCCQGWDPLL